MQTICGYSQCCPGRGKERYLPRVLPRSYLFTQMEAFYVPVKKSGVRMNISKTKTDAITGKRALIPILRSGDVFKPDEHTCQRGSGAGSAGPGRNRKEKYYRITASGTLVLQLA